VQPGSLQRGDNLAVSFTVADGSATLPVAYKGILPDLFREGQGVIAEGALDVSGVFRADTVLAKHDETYMPKEVADASRNRATGRTTTAPNQAIYQAPRRRRPRELCGDRRKRTLCAGARARAGADPSRRAAARRALARCALMNVARSTALVQLLFRSRRRSPRW